MGGDRRLSVVIDAYVMKKGNGGIADRVEGGGAATRKITRGRGKRGGTVAIMRTTAKRRGKEGSGLTRRDALLEGERGWETMAGSVVEMTTALGIGGISLRRAHLGCEMPAPVDERGALDAKSGKDTVIGSNPRMRKKPLDGEKGITEIQLTVQMVGEGIMMIMAAIEHGMKTVGRAPQKKARHETKRSRRRRVNHHQQLCRILMWKGLVVSTSLLTRWHK